MGLVEVTVRLKREPSIDVDAAVRELERAGLRDVELTRRFAIVHGRIATERLEAVERLDAVLSVRSATTFAAA